MSAFRGAELKQELAGAAGARDLIVQEGQGRTPVLAGKVGNVISTPAVTAADDGMNMQVMAGITGPQLH